ncbi:hypothetical protein B0H17DRAFT_1192305 [Mycena rosella]|uniref:Uncharacterized protein n=1 Tax=Mycena rosella TaxID=1033263 RepID=A0AAD7GWQ9_MYCRO|nr:hypothetical protein B0H17DRAFT_1192305 [Mycena rosella]
MFSRPRSQLFKLSRYSAQLRSSHLPESKLADRPKHHRAWHHDGSKRLEKQYESAWPHPGPAPDVNAAIHKDWYRSPLVKEPFSCNWREWGGVLSFKHNEIEADYNDGFNIAGTIEPLAFLDAASEDFWFFTAGGKYYYYDEAEDIVGRIDGEFESHDDFIREVCGERPGQPTSTTKIHRCKSYPYPVRFI